MEVIVADELAQKYQQKTDREHILSTPDTYIGSVEQIDDVHWILNEDGSKIISKTIQTVPVPFDVQLWCYHQSHILYRCHQ